MKFDPKDGWFLAGIALGGLVVTFVAVLARPASEPKPEDPIGPWHWVNDRRIRLECGTERLDALTEKVTKLDGSIVDLLEAMQTMHEPAFVERKWDDTRWYETPIKSPRESKPEGYHDPREPESVRRELEK